MLQNTFKFLFLNRPVCCFWLFFFIKNVTSLECINISVYGRLKARITCLIINETDMFLTLCALIYTDPKRFQVFVFQETCVLFF